MRALLVLIGASFLISFFGAYSFWGVLTAIAITIAAFYWAIRLMEFDTSKLKELAKRKWFWVVVGVTLLALYIFVLSVTARDTSSFSDWFIEGLLFTLNLISSGAITALVVYLLWRLISRKISPQAERPDILASTEVQEKVKAANVTDDGVLAGFLEKQSIHISCEDRAVVIGPPGTGKTAFLVSQLLDWAESGRPFIVNDIKPEIYGIVHSRLEKMGYRLFTYNPTSGTGQRYNFLEDIESPESIGELAAALIPAIMDENVVFYESARDLLDALISHIKGTEEGASLPAVRELLSKFNDIKELLGALQNSPSADAREISSALSILSKNNRLFGSVFATLRANLRFLRYPKIRASLAASDFSLKSFCKGKKVGLFLQFEESHQETTRTLFSVLISHVLRYFIEHNPSKPVLMLFDEIGNVPPVVGLVKKLNTIRSRQLPTWLYFQNKEQMQVYGRKFIFRNFDSFSACDFG